MLLNQQNLDELELFIKNVNKSFDNDGDCTVINKISLDNFSIRLLRILKQVNKSDISRILKLSEENDIPLIITKATSHQNIQSFNRESVLNIFNSLSQDELIKRYSLLELEQMYVSVMGSKPLSKGRTKRGIINSIYRYMHTIKRARDFF